MAEDIHAFFHEKRNRAVIESLVRVEVKPIVPRWFRLSRISGKTFVLTGGLASMTRDEAKDRLAALGAKVSESVSRNTDYVVIGVARGSKADRARELGITTINEKEFLELIGARS